MKKNYGSLFCFIGIILMIPYILQAQQHKLWHGKEAYNWTFGNQVGLEFSSGSPLPFPNVQSNADEGSAVISSSNGELLFYAAGVGSGDNTAAIWNKNHEFMVNGTGLLGDQSSTQFGVIIPKPNDPNIYYLFQVSTIHGLLYSEIDMTLDTGNGAVTENKNILLSEDALLEKITAINHANGKDVWVISHLMGSDEFIAYLVTETGVSAAPVISASGVSYPHFYGMWSPSMDAAVAPLKASPDGTKLAAVSCGLFDIENGIRVFDFNNATGEVSNPIFLKDFSNLDALSGVHNPLYGVEFSPNSRYLYSVPFLSYSDLNVYQFDLDAGDENAIKDSRTIIASFTDPDVYYQSGGMQLAPNGKIYIANTRAPLSDPTISVINYPNNAGLASGFEADAVDLGEKKNILGLPTFIQSYFESGILYDGSICPTEEVKFSTLRIPGITAIAWDFGDPDSGTANASSIIEATHIFSGSGTYTVTAHITSNGAVQIATTKVIIIEGPKAVVPRTGILTQCADNNGNAVFNLSSFSSTILDGQDTAVFSITYFATDADRITNNPIADLSNFTTAGQTIYAVVTSSETGCHTVLPLNLIVNPLPLVTIPSNLAQCGNWAGNAVFNLSSFNSTILDGQDTAVFSIAYFATDADRIANNPIADLSNFTTTGQTIYVLVSNSETGCKTVLPLNLVVNPVPVVITPPNLEQCGNLAGETIFNLKIQDAVILNGQNPEGFTITYYTDAAMTNVISQPERFTSAGQTIYIQITNKSTGCSTLISFKVNVTAMDLITEELLVEGCLSFNLTLANSQIPGVLTVGFYSTQEDALKDTNVIVDIENYRPAANIDKVYVVVTNADGCQSINELKLQSVGCIIPRGISPNGDGMNDTFDLSGFNVKHLTVFNRYGQEVYTKDNYTNQWDGQGSNGDALPTGTYYYMIQLVNEEKTGWVYINREIK